MNFTLINPPFIFPDRSSIVPSHCLGLRYLSSYLKSAGHQVCLVDSLMAGYSQVRSYDSGYLVGLDIPAIVQAIPADTGLIGVSAPFSQLASVLHDLISAIKTAYPATPLILGGVYPSTEPEYALDSMADYIVVGEGEDAILRIASGESPERIRGVYSRTTARKDMPFPATHPIRNLDDIPFPDISFPGVESYFRRSPRKFSVRQTASIITSRGCPHCCEFCSIHPVYGRGWRGRSAENVLAEVELLNSKFKVTHFEIEDDNFTLDKQRTIRILEGIIKLQDSGKRITWSTPNGIRIDTLDEELIRLIVRSGCTEIVLALENGDPEMLAVMVKNLDLEKAFEVITLLVKHGMQSIVVFVIVGYPGETEERFQNSLKTLRRIRLIGGNKIHVCANIAQPYPGTRLLERCKEGGWLVNEDGHHDQIGTRQVMTTTHTVSIITPDFGRDDILNRVRQVEEVFDGRIRHILKSIGPFRQAVRFIRRLWVR